MLRWSTPGREHVNNDDRRAILGLTHEQVGNERIPVAIAQGDVSGQGLLGIAQGLHEKPSCLLANFFTWRVGHRPASQIVSKQRDLLPLGSLPVAGAPTSTRV
ncbi:MAG TPA: hypothetical protein QGF35_08115 [Dehalococcoidia bacterium]|nr:hypothetical protein [Dehalococcoidia bacterium]